MTPDGSRLVAVQTALPVPSSSNSGTLLILSDQGADLGQIKTDAEAIDLLVLPAR
jgi:hypothetical protein